MYILEIQRALAKPLLWDPRMLVGHPQMDLEHQKFLALYNIFLQCFADPEPSLLARGAFSAISVFTEMHFSMENKLMFAYDYPDRDAHLALHTKSIRELDQLIFCFRDENFNSASIIPEIFTWRDSIIQNKEDKLLADHIQKVGSCLK